MTFEVFFWGLIALVVICLIAAVYLDIRLNRHVEATRKNFSVVAGGVKQFAETTTGVVTDLATKVEEVRWRAALNDEIVDEIAARLNEQDERLLRGIFQARLGDGTFREERPKQIQTSGPRCKQCGAFTTKKRVETHGLCMKCENDKRVSSGVTRGKKQTPVRRKK